MWRRGADGDGRERREGGEKSRNVLGTWYETVKEQDKHDKNFSLLLRSKRKEGP